ncbi:MAG: DUF2784 family protein [Bdellovibrionota bacterium]
MTKTLIRILQLTHTALLLFVMTACFLPWKEVWLVHLVFVPLMFLHWKTNRNRCVLTQIEARLKGEREVPEGGFIKGLWIKIFKRAPSERTLQRLINSILVVVWTTSVLRYLGDAVINGDRTS